MTIHVVTKLWNTTSDGSDCVVLNAFQKYEDAVKFLKEAAEKELEESYRGDRSCIDVEKDYFRSLFDGDKYDLFEMHEVELS